MESRAGEVLGWRRKTKDRFRSRNGRPKGRLGKKVKKIEKSAQE